MHKNVYLCKDKGWFVDTLELQEVAPSEIRVPK